MSNFGERLEAFLASTRFEAAVSAFLGAHIESLTFTEADGEQDVVSYSVFLKFTEMVQEKLQDFVDEEKLSPEEFQKRCAEAVESGSGVALVDRLLRLSDYNSFMDAAIGFCPPPDDD
uniref:BART domain-containing protein n=1 Tax=Tetraselmis chuii TaxID=63592 RepID=A0A7S1SK50_9CHLO|mmetsp:Transcript_15623/g.27684  ORF Transcript_15623/g.27684 Transcript_15623/m.27684 type:complete len:118 (+) Transcript_15623:204-557(+)